MNSEILTLVIFNSKYLSIIAIQKIKLEMQQQVLHSESVMKQWFDGVNLLYISIQRNAWDWYFGQNIYESSLM